MAAGFRVWIIRDDQSPEGDHIEKHEFALFRDALECFEHAVEEEGRDRVKTNWLDPAEFEEMPF